MRVVPIDRLTHDACDYVALVCQYHCQERGQWYGIEVTEKDQLPWINPPYSVVLGVKEAEVLIGLMQLAKSLCEHLSRGGTLQGWNRSTTSGGGPPKPAPPPQRRPFIDN